jgi:Ca2+/Na+ antiporter
MAFSNVFGSNSFDLLLLFPVSILAVQTFGTRLPASSIFMAALSAVLTAVYLWSLLEHSRSVARIGIDSMLVLILFFAGMGVFYGLS